MRICDRHFDLPHPLMKRLPKDVNPSLHMPAPVSLPPRWLNSVTVVSPRKTRVTSPNKSMVFPLSYSSVEKDEFDGGSPRRRSPRKLTSSRYAASTSTSNLTIDIPDNAIEKCLQFGSPFDPQLALRPIDLDIIPIAEPSKKQYISNHNEIKKLQKRLRYAMRKKISYKKKLSKTKSTELNFSKLTEIQKRFFSNHLENAGKKKKGRRYTIDDKVLALAIFKSSPKAYRLMSQILTLPHPNVLRELSSRIEIKPGICEPVMRSLKHQVARMSSENRLCVLMFDEMMLSAHLEYDEKQDRVIGFEDVGGLYKFKVPPRLADHVQVFMLRGIYRRWKQPVAFNFCKHTTSAEIMVTFYEAIVNEANSIGLTVVASVCDQGSTNMRAINILQERTARILFNEGKEHRDLNVIRVGNNSVIHIYDPPHLLKCIRNNLLRRNLVYKLEDSVERVASWGHIVAAYNIDSAKLGRVMQKVTQYHVDEKKIPLMKVSKCAQVFSFSMFSAIEMMVELGAENPKGLGAECMDTAFLCKFFDDLFDSVNGGLLKKPHKRLRRVVTERSLHRQTWSKARAVLNSMSYVKKSDTDKAKVPALGNWIYTLNGFELIQKRLLDLGHESFSARVFNQDPLENFFGQVRQFGSRNINPTCSAFVHYFKSLLLNNFTSVHTPGFNCRADRCTILLTTLKEFITQGVSEPVEPFIWNPPDLPISMESLEPLEECAVAYIAGWVAKKVLPLVSDCVICADRLLHTSSVDLDVHRFVNIREVDDDIRRLKRCNLAFLEFIVTIYNSIQHWFPLVLRGRDFLLFNLKSHIHDKIPLPPPVCPRHPDLKEKVINSFLRLMLFTYLKRVDNIIYGKESHVLSSDDDIQVEALQYAIDRKRNRLRQTAMRQY